ncbi:hypothetical protein [Methylobacterium iners]|uniref:Uncharacterized protein n=1 Tax=Methylobacterium iners TaxID=418707 RepID=A0ABQ4RXX4_9HYPH|nr:hypothetical protein [Methylobacterium iners]GJD95245.1 hypothetical protein OCOJLMKI_2456 [Methylobacterium iners]
MTILRNELRRRSISRRHLVQTGAAFAATAAMFQDATARGSLPENFNGVAVYDETADGRIIVSDSLSYLTRRLDLMGPLRVSQKDVVVGCSFAGRQTFADPLSLGPRGLIGHAAGVGKDNAGIAGLAMAQDHGVPAAACRTMSARMSDGRSLFLERVIGHLNEAAMAAGVRENMTVREAAYRLLAAPEGRVRTVESGAGSHTGGKVTMLLEGDAGGICAAWFIALIKEKRPNDVFVTAPHCGETMAEYTLAVRPRGIIANDAGLCKDRSGVIGLAMLEREGIPAAAVGALSARIGDEISSYQDGVISEANAQAAARGVKPGMPCREAAHALLR